MSYWIEVKQNERSRWQIPDEPGVYVIATDKGLYIGQSTKMRTRRFVYSHFNWMDSGFYKVLWIKVKRSRREFDWRMDEGRLIKKLKPALNRGGWKGARRRGMVSISGSRPKEKIVPRSDDNTLVGKFFSVCPRDGRAYTKTSRGWTWDAEAERLINAALGIKS